MSLRNETDITSRLGPTIIGLQVTTVHAPRKPSSLALLAEQCGQSRTGVSYRH